METHARTLARALSYRICALFITAIWTGLSEAVMIHVVLTALYYAMERMVWAKISWGFIDAPARKSCCDS